MLNTATQAAAASRFSRTGQIENALTDFLAIVQGMKAISGSGRDYSCAMDFLIEKLEETYRALEDLHGQEEVH